jgi:hypothetical protein
MASSKASASLCIVFIFLLNAANTSEKLYVSVLFGVLTEQSVGAIFFSDRRAT